MEGRGILGFDTATADAVVGVTVDGEPLVERRADPGPGGRPRHAAALLGEIEAAVGEAGGWERIGRLVVGVGPGTFTGLRIGVATARALAQARSLPLAGVPSLDALARGLAERAGGRPRLALIDARRGEAFGALYDAAGERAGEPFVAAPEEIVERLPGGGPAPLAAGDGSLRFREQLEAAGVEVPPAADEAHRMAARHLCALAAAVEPEPAADVRPIYLRRPDAEVWREQRDRDPAAG